MQYPNIYITYFSFKKYVCLNKAFYLFKIRFFLLRAVQKDNVITFKKRTTDTSFRIPSPTTFSMNTIIINARCITLHVLTISRATFSTFSLLSAIYNNIHESCIFIFLTYISIVAPFVAILHVAYTECNVHKE